MRKRLVSWWLGLTAVEVGGEMAGCGIMHGEGAGVPVGWRVGGVGRVEGASGVGASVGVGVGIKSTILYY